MPPEVTRGPRDQMNIMGDLTPFPSGPHALSARSFDTSDSYPIDEGYDDTQKSIAKIPKTISAVQDAFREIGQIVKRLDYVDDSCLRMKWKTISEKYSTLLSAARDEATQAKLIINDMLRNVIPYLLDPKVDLSERMQSLSEYAKKILEGVEKTAIISKEFKSISEAVLEFNDDWQNTYLQRPIDDVRRNRGRLREEIDRVANRLQELSGDLAEFIWYLQQNKEELSGSAERRKYTKAKNELIKRGLKAMDAAPTIQLHVKAIEENNHSMVTVWISIKGNMYGLAEQLQLCTMFKNEQMFQSRVKAAEIQFSALKEIFSAYAQNATNAPPNVGILSRLFAKLGLAY